MQRATSTMLSERAKRYQPINFGEKAIFGLPDSPHQYGYLEDCEEIVWGDPSEQIIRRGNLDSLNLNS